MNDQHAKITWTDEEKELIVGNAVKLKPLKTWDSPLFLFREAQLVMPPDRRRRIRALSEIPWFIPAVNQAILSGATPGRVVDLTELLSDYMPIQKDIIRTNLLEQQEQGHTLKDQAESLAQVCVFLGRLEGLGQQILWRLDRLAELVEHQAESVTH
jgi:hypothetical protein